jgi:SNF2 family DNA or RNA helicase
VVEFRETGEVRKIPFSSLTPRMRTSESLAKGWSRDAKGLDLLRTKMMATVIKGWNDLTGALENLNIDPLPHQIHLVHQMLSGPTQNWLVADDVGLGKTIEVGLYVTALQRRGLARRILVVTPAAVTVQWRMEMLRKFGLTFEIFGETMPIRAPEDWHGPGKNLVIASMDRVKPSSTADDGSEFSTSFGKIMQTEPWDLVVIDEAHRLTKAASGKSSLRWKLGEALSGRTRSLLLLTGTPHQGDNVKFANLLKLVRKDLSREIDCIEEDPRIVREIVLRNKKINVTDAEGNFVFKGYKVVQQWVDSPRATALMGRLNDYAARCREGAASMPDRNLANAVGFVMTGYRKLAASSPVAAMTALKNRLDQIEGRTGK